MKIYNKITYSASYRTERDMHNLLIVRSFYSVLPKNT